MDRFIAVANNRQLTKVIFLVLAISNLGNGCSSVGSKSSRTEVSNEIETFPSLFAASTDLSKSRASCPKSYPPNSCKLVQVNLEALAAPKMNFPVLFSDSSISAESPITLKKTTEEGLKMVLTDPATPATATVTYKVLNGRFLFEMFFPLNYN